MIRSQDSAFHKIYQTTTGLSTFLLLISSTLLFTSSLAHAHYPLMTCNAEKQLITCEAGFSDGSPATNKRVSVLDYNENLLQKLTTDKRSQVSFTRPEGEFYIRFDAGHEAPVEIDYDEL